MINNETSKKTLPAINYSSGKESLFLRLKSFFLLLIKEKPFSLKLNRYAMIFMLAITIAALSLAGYFWRQSRINSDVDSAVSDDASKIIMRVDALMVLPQDEKPTVATVSDPAALKNQPFFVGAQKGDRVIIYSKAGKAILYDPVANKIVNVAPINLGNSPAAK